MSHNVECAFYGSTSRPFLVPILESGMMVRDYATYIRDMFSIAEHTDVILCGAEDGAPHKGKYWILPNTALQIYLKFNAQYKTPAPVVTAAPGIMPAEADDVLPPYTVDVAMDSILLDLERAQGVAAVAILSPHRNIAESDIHVVTINNVTSASECDRKAAEEAVQYTRRKLNDETCVLRLHSASPHLCRTNDAVQHCTMRWMNLRSSVLTRLRLYAVKSAAKL